MDALVMHADKAQRVSVRFEDATVIIPTKNRPDDIALALSSLFEQTVLPCELIIVDQSQTNATRDCVYSLYEAQALRIRRMSLKYIHDPSISGAAVARNAAMDCATGAYWVFLDDDVILEPEFLAELLNTYRDRPNVTGVSGIITNYPVPPWRTRLFRRVFKHGPFRDERQDIYWHADTLRESEPIAVSRMGGGLMSFRASEVRGLRFDSQLRNTSEGEDVEFCHHLKGWGRLVVNPRARLEHKKTPAARAQEHWMRPEVRGITYLFRRLWNTNPAYRLCYAWLITGYTAMAMAACLRRRSLGPWRDFSAGIRDCYNSEPVER